MAIFKFHSVGQGLFYSGQINNFNFIFDIGSLNKGYITREINSYVTHALGGNSDVDYVFLSHLDKDHISGLIYLMTKLDKSKHVIKCVVLPYIPGFDSLYLLLRSKGIEVLPISDDSADSSLVQLNKQFQAVWKFSVFYVRPQTVTSQAIDSLTRSVPKISRYSLKKVLTKSIYANIVSSPLWDKNDLKRIQQVFDQLTGEKNRNEASLNLVHGPIKNNKALMTDATVLTGDSNWNRNGDIYMSKWLKKQMNSLSDVKFFQVPHHGAKKELEPIAKLGSKPWFYKHNFYCYHRQL